MLPQLVIFRVVAEAPLCELADVEIEMGLRGDSGIHQGFDAAIVDLLELDNWVQQETPEVFLILTSNPSFSKSIQERFFAWLRVFEFHSESCIFGIIMLSTQYDQNWTIRNVQA